MKPARPLSTRLAYLLATWFGCGYSRYAPGTVGSLGTLPLYVVLQACSPLVYWSVTALLTVLGCFAAQRVAVVEGKTDPGLVVIDEVSGVLITLGLMRADLLLAVTLGFALFRLFDITKPWPIRRLEHVPPAGLGIMLDDVFAGVLAGAIGHAVVLYLAARAGSITPLPLPL